LHTKSAFRLLTAGVLALVTAFASACSTPPGDSPPPTIPVAEPAVSPPVTGVSDGVVKPLSAPGTAAFFDIRTSALVVLGPADQLTVLPTDGPTRTLALPAAATALTGDGSGEVWLSTRGGYLRVNVAAAAATPVEVDGHADTDFTAIARHTDGRLVLGSADGTLYTLRSDTEVGATLKKFARVDVLVAQDDSMVVLDRGQTSVTEIDGDGAASEQSLRAGEGATSMATDAAGRVLVTDTRGGALLVYGTEPLILRQRFPVHDAPYGVTGSPELAWVSQTATNTVVGYDLATGIPVEKVRYRTVQQPNTLAFDDAENTLYVVSGSGAGVQVITGAAPR
jgi:sugar lactone lactonase YvrE